MLKNKSNSVYKITSVFFSLFVAITLISCDPPESPTEPPETFSVNGVLFVTDLNESGFKVYLPYVDNADSASVVLSNLTTSNVFDSRTVSVFGDLLVYSNCSDGTDYQLTYRVTGVPGVTNITTTIKTHEIVFFEDFNDTNTTFFLGEILDYYDDPIGDAYLDNGKYGLEMDYYGYGRFVQNMSNASFDFNRNFYMEIEISKIVSDYYEFSFVFYKEELNNLSFSISSDGEFCIETFRDGDYFTIPDWEYNVHIKTGSEKNKLRIEKTSLGFHFKINDFEVCSIPLANVNHISDCKDFYMHYYVEGKLKLDNFRFCYMD